MYTILNPFTNSIIEPNTFYCGQWELTGGNLDYMSSKEINMLLPDAKFMLLETKADLKWRKDMHFDAMEYFGIYDEHSYDWETVEDDWNDLTTIECDWDSIKTENTDEDEIPY